MPSEGIYLLSNVGFSGKEKPLLLAQNNDNFIDIYPYGHTFTLFFDLNQRFCTGWRNIETGERFTCPHNQEIDQKYEQCNQCQKRTGFNPAFYHASSVSPQQEARNKEPHILYLAYFGQNLTKVGISHAKRGNGRLLEQGARTALILDTLATAHIARHYEAKIAKLSGFVETVQLRKKLSLLLANYDSEQAANELMAVKASIETSLGVTFNDARLLHLDGTYFPNGTPDLSSAHDTSNNNLISGTCIGQAGSILLCEQDNSIFCLPLKKYVGYRMTISNATQTIDTPARQTSLF